MEGCEEGKGSLMFLFVSHLVFNLYMHICTDDMCVCVCVLTLCHII